MADDGREDAQLGDLMMDDADQSCASCDGAYEEPVTGGKTGGGEPSTSMWIIALAVLAVILVIYLVVRSRKTDGGDDPKDKYYRGKRWSY